VSDAVSRRRKPLSFSRALALASALCCTAALAQAPVRIGMVVEMTGAYAEYGPEAMRGATLALEEINRAGGVLGQPLDIVTEDNQSTNPGSEVSVSHLLANREVKAIITTLHSSQVNAMMPAIAQAGVPALIGGTSHSLTQANNPWIFRVRPHDGYSARVIADFGVNTLKKRKWAIVHAADSFGIDAKDRLTQALKPLGITPVTVQGVNSQTQNFTPVGLAVKKAGVDVVATYLPAMAAGNFARQLRQSGVDSQLIGSTSLSSLRARRIAMDALDNSYSVRDYVADANPQAKAFARRYADKWAGEADLRAAWVYDAVHLVALAINNAGSAAPAAVREALLAVRNHPGVLGTFDFDANGDGLHGYTIVRNKGDDTVLVKRVSFSAK
jgi:branched-chain amino acid transport system substrate-binding protein